LEAAIHKHKRDIDDMERTFDEIFTLQQELYKEKLATKDKTAATTIAMSQHQAALYFLGYHCVHLKFFTLFMIFENYNN
jgi:hypothetical protein